MRISTGLVGTAIAIGLSACQGSRAGRPIETGQTPSADWRTVATPADRTRLRNWRGTWMRAVVAARTADGGAIARDPGLFLPDRALASDAPAPPGVYRCRVFKLGVRTGAIRAAFVARPSFECRIDQAGALTRFSKYTGIQRLAGTIYPERPARSIFLGTLVLGDEARAIAYGRDASRDSVGIVERIGERRWRLALPEPRFESQLDLIELIPSG